MRKATFGIGRGVWLAPWRGPNGEMILVAVTRDGRRIDERVLRPQDGHVQAADELWEMLERVDPMPALQVI